MGGGGGAYPDEGGAMRKKSEIGGGGVIQFSNYTPPNPTSRISPAVGSYWEPWLLTKDNDKDDEIILPAIQCNVPNALQPSACS